MATSVVSTNSLSSLRPHPLFFVRCTIRLLTGEKSLSCCFEQYLESGNNRQVNCSSTVELPHRPFTIPQTPQAYSFDTNALTSLAMDDFSVFAVPEEPYQPHPCMDAYLCPLQSSPDMSYRTRAATLAHLAFSTPLNEDRNDVYQAYCIIT